MQLAQRNRQHQKVQRNPNTRMRPRKRIPINTPPLTLAIPPIPKEIHRRTRKHTRHDKRPRIHPIQHQRPHKHPLDRPRGKNPHVEKHQRHLYQRNPRRVKDLQHKQALGHLRDIILAQRPDISPEAVPHRAEAREQHARDAKEHGGEDGPVVGADGRQPAGRALDAQEDLDVEAGADCEEGEDEEDRGREVELVLAVADGDAAGVVGDALDREGFFDGAGGEDAGGGGGLEFRGFADAGLVEAAGRGGRG